MEALLNWLPLILLVAVFFLVMRFSNSSYKKHIDRVEAINEEILEQNRQMIGELREIKTLLRERK